MARRANSRCLRAAKGSSQGLLGEVALSYVRGNFNVTFRGRKLPDGVTRHLIREEQIRRVFGTNNPLEIFEGRGEKMRGERTNSNATFEWYEVGETMFE